MAPGEPNILLKLCQKSNCFVKKKKIFKIISIDFTGNWTHAGVSLNEICDTAQTLPP